MKNLFTIMIVFVLVSCGSNIDKKIDYTEYGKVIEEIKKSNTEFTPEDFSVAARMLDPLIFQSKGNSELDITYRELLQKAKAANEKKAAEFKAYQESLKPLNDALSMNIEKGKYQYRSEVAMYNNHYAHNVLIKSKSDKVIVGIEGTFYLYNDKEELIKKITFNKSGVLEPAEEITLQESSIIFEDEKLKELKVIPFEKLKVVWEPKEIIFEGGERLTALSKPIS